MKKTMNFTLPILRNLFHKPATRLYPFEKRASFERTRGHIDIKVEDCIFCGICAKKCPTGAIAVNREDKTWAIERFDCIQCNCCTEVCPKKCLHMGNAYTAPGTEKTKDVAQGA